MTASGAASAPAAAASPSALALAPATRQALEQSEQRVAEQPPGWHTVALGTLAPGTSLAALDALPLQGPLYLVRRPDQKLELRYGSFPSTDAADAALAQVNAWSVPGLSGTPAVVTFGR